LLRVAEFNKILEASELPSELLESLLIPLSDLDEQWRDVIPSSLRTDATSTAVNMSDAGRLMMLRAYTAWEDDSKADGEMKQTDKWKRRTLKAFTAVHELQEYVL